MKQNKLFSLDPDIIERLQNEKNASKIVNDYLIEYYATGKYKEKAEIEFKLKELETEIHLLMDKGNELNIKLEEIEKQEKETKEKFKNVPNEVLDDFKFWPNMSEEVFLTRFKEYHKKYPKFTKDIAIKSYKEYFKKWN